MPKTKIEVSHEFKDSGDKQQVHVTLDNTSEKLAFFIELDIKGEKSGETILPVFWDDNYVSGLPGEKKEIAGYFYTKALKNDIPSFSYKGWYILRE